MEQREVVWYWLKCGFYELIPAQLDKLAACTEYLRSVSGQDQIFLTSFLGAFKSTIGGAGKKLAIMGGATTEYHWW